MKIDYKKIAEELIPIFEEGKQIMLSPGPAVRKAKMMLKDLNDKDYLLLIGDPSMIGLACSVAADYNRGRYKVLKYDRRSFTYYPIQIDINERNNYDRQSLFYKSITRRRKKDG